MGKNNYSGIEVYVSKLKDGTRFNCNNGAWSGEFKINNGIPVVVIEEDTIMTASNNKVINISTNEDLPFEAYVYKSVYYAQEFKKESKKLEELYFMIRDVLLTQVELDEIINKIDSTIKHLNYLKSKFVDMEPENY